MRRSVPAALAAVALTVGLAAPAAAHPGIEITPPLDVDLTHAATDNVGFVARFHEHFGTAGGALTSNEWNDGAPFYVVTDPRGVFTYDVANPEAPELLGFLLLNQVVGADGIVYPLPSTQTALAQEDPSTDGYLLPVDGSTTDGTLGLHLVDISDPTNPTVAGVLPGLTDHTWTCVSDQSGNGCAYVYGRDDNIVDATDPASPVKLDTGWKAATGEGGYAHDLTEIRPGLVMHAGAEPVLMDTTDPTAPVKISHITLFDHGAPYIPQRQWSTFGYHSVEWPNAGTDDFLILGTELAPPGPTNNAGSDCNSDQSVIETWDARPVLAAFDELEQLKADGMSHEDARAAVFGDGDLVKFERIDSYMAFDRGIFLDGQSPAHVLYCAHWMEANPSWEDGGILSVGYYDRGNRFVQVDSDGMMTELGWFVGAEAYTGSSQWITDELVYVMDYRRGMDIVRINPDVEASGTYEATGSVSDNAMTVAELEAMGIAPPVEDEVPSGAITLLGLTLAAVAVLRRRATA